MSRVPTLRASPALPFALRLGRPTRPSLVRLLTGLTQLTTTAVALASVALASAPLAALQSMPTPLRQSELTFETAEPTH